MSANSTLFPKKSARLIDDACALARWLPPWLAKSSFGARDAAVRLTRRSSAMTYAMKPLSYDPNRIRGMSERMIISHCENNDSGASNRKGTSSCAVAPFAAADDRILEGV
jgi:hypothetical protein